MSNDIKNWKPIPNLKIRGIVKNITVWFVIYSFYLYIYTKYLNG
jgi:hypothetical protein